MASVTMLAHRANSHQMNNFLNYTLILPNKFLLLFHRRLVSSLFSQSVWCKYQISLFNNDFGTATKMKTINLNVQTMAEKKISEINDCRNMNLIYWMWRKWSQRSYAWSRSKNVCYMQINFPKLNRKKTEEKKIIKIKHNNDITYG